MISKLNYLAWKALVSAAFAALERSGARADRSLVVRPQQRRGRGSSILPDSTDGKCQAGAKRKDKGRENIWH